MEDVNADKENNNSNSISQVNQCLSQNADHMINLIECKKLVVANKLTHEPVEINTGKKAFFALL